MLPTKKKLGRVIALHRISMQGFIVLNFKHMNYICLSQKYSSGERQCFSNCVSLV